MLKLHASERFAMNPCVALPDVVIPDLASHPPVIPDLAQRASGIQWALNTRQASAMAARLNAVWIPDTTPSIRNDGGLTPSIFSVFCVFSGQIAL